MPQNVAINRVMSAFQVTMRHLQGLSGHFKASTLALHHQKRSARVARGTHSTSVGHRCFPSTHLQAPSPPNGSISFTRRRMHPRARNGPKAGRSVRPRWARMRSPRFRAQRRGCAPALHAARSWASVRRCFPSSWHRLQPHYMAALPAGIKRLSCGFVALPAPLGGTMVMHTWQAHVR